MAKKTDSLPKSLNDLREARRWPEGVPMPKAGAFRLGSKWTYDEEQLLRKYYPLYGARYAARLLGRSIAAVHGHARQLGEKCFSRKPWTKQDIALLKRKFGKVPYEELARELGRTVGAMRLKASKWGFTNAPKSWSSKEIEQLRKLYKTMTAAEIGRRLGRTAGSVTTALKKHGISRPWPKVTKSVVRTIMKKLETMSMQEIGAELGMSAPRISKIARENGYRAERHWWKNEFQPTEDSFIREHYATMPAREIARHLGRHQSVIARRMKQLGLRTKLSYHQREVRWSKREDDLLRRLHPKMTHKEIAARLKCSKQAVAYRCSVLGLKRQEEPRLQWTAKEDAMLRKLYGTMNHPEIAKRLGRTRNAVTGRVQVLGLTKERPMVNRWTEEDDKVLRRLYGSVTQAEIGRRLNRTYGSVGARIQLLGLSRARALSQRDSKSV